MRLFKYRPQSSTFRTLNEYNNMYRPPRIAHPSRFPKAAKKKLQQNIKISQRTSRQGNRQRQFIEFSTYFFYPKVYFA